MELEQIFRSAAEKLEKADLKAANKVAQKNNKMLKRIQDYTEKFLGKDFLSYVDANYTLVQGFKENPHKGIVEIKSKDETFIVNFDYYLQKELIYNFFPFYKTEEYLSWIDGFKSTDPEAREVFLKTFEYEWKTRSKPKEFPVDQDSIDIPGKFATLNVATEEETIDFINEIYKDSVPDPSEYLGEEVVEVVPDLFK